MPRACGFKSHLEHQGELAPQSNQCGLGAPRLSYAHLSYVLLTQLVECHPYKLEVGGSSPSKNTTTCTCENRFIEKQTGTRVALSKTLDKHRRPDQWEASFIWGISSFLVEHPPCKRKVMGSNPIFSTIWGLKQTAKQRRGIPK